MSYEKTINLQETRLSKQTQAQLINMEGLTVSYYTHAITGMKHIVMTTKSHKVMLQVNQIVNN